MLSTAVLAAGEIWNRRTMTANTATFEAVARNAATGAGAPSYTSGVHKWKGTRDNLNARPTSIIAMPNCASGLAAPLAARA
ncbi:hypothetical protein D3C81_2158560 [compost metagenome]